MERATATAGASVDLGADAWILLSGAAAGVDWPPPFGPADGPELTAGQRDAAERALRASALVTGDSGDLVADLHPSIRASLLVHAAPMAVVDLRAGLGEDQRVARYALQGEIASAVARDVRAAGDGGVELGPVTLAALPVEEVVPGILAALGDLDGLPDREPLTLDAAEALALARALAGDEPDLAGAIAADGIPEPIAELAGGLRAVARIDLAGAGRAAVLVLVRGDGGWWRATIAGEALDLEPVDAATLASDLAGELGDLLTGRAPG